VDRTGYDHDRTTAELRAAYDAAVEEREGRPVDGWKVDERDRFTTLLVRAGARSLLDVGPGVGRDSLHFAEHGLAVRAVDLSPAMVERCRAKGIDAVVGDVTRLDPALGPVDAVWSLNCLLHVPDVLMGPTLAGLHDVLVPGGLFYLGCFGGDGREGTWESDHYRPRRFYSFRTMSQLRGLVEPVFEVLDARTVGPARFHALVLRRRPDQP
jgi:SAM-dependent methyltransferase